MSQPNPNRISRERLTELFKNDVFLISSLVTMDNSAYRSVMSQARFVGMETGTAASRGYYERKPVAPAAVVLAHIRSSVDGVEWFKLRNTISYLRSSYKRTTRQGETEAEKRARYQREYYARRKREAKMQLVRVVLPRELYKEVCDSLDAAGRPDLTEKVIASKVGGK